MAIFQLQISSLSRGTGRRATAAAAYRAGERVRDERSGQLHNHSRRRDVLHAEILLPTQFEGIPIAWARNRERLWNTAEHAEKHHNSRVAREYEVALPPELNPEQRVALARTFARAIAERYKVAVDLAVHEPRPGSDPRNFHAHLLTTTRELTPTGLGAKAGLDMPPRERHRRGLADHRREYVNVRECWATLANEALRAANLTVRVDHRSLAARGIDREPRPHIPLMHLRMEQRGVPSAVAEQLRAEYLQRVQRRRELAALTERVATAERVLTQQGLAGATLAASPGQAQATDRAGATDHAPTADHARGSGHTGTTDVEEIKRRAREAWLSMRPREAERSSAQTRDPPQGRERSERDEVKSEPEPQDDLAL